MRPSVAKKRAVEITKIIKHIKDTPNGEPYQETYIHHLRSLYRAYMREVERYNEATL